MISASLFSVEAGGRCSAEISPEQEDQKGLISESTALTSSSTPPHVPPHLLLLCSEVMKPIWNLFEEVEVAGS